MGSGSDGRATRNSSERCRVIRTAAAPAPRKATSLDSEREAVRKHARSSRSEQQRSTKTEQRTTGSATSSTRVRVGDRLPDSVEIRSFPDAVYRESPRLREHRYIERENRTYLIEPGERRIIEECCCIDEGGFQL
jgi:hypothetical protein